MDVAQALPYVMPFVALFGLISGIWYRVEGKINAGVADAKASGMAAQKRAEEAEKSLFDFKLKVAEEYASWETVRSIESRLTERMDDLTQNVMKMPDAIVDRIVNMLRLAQHKG
ncbi:hypothetical protein [Bradyrhizobium sp. SZCCHNS3053]|uniref:hypothetical protein n=1 Tax=Bradyrhizobium sp. SZCCHNS3053 TaxID=3057322 RepID=UPI0029169AE8|nr:hypothetical protein [Bradyrhizobium sp. SZCCHNS3053]